MQIPAFGGVLWEILPEKTPPSAEKQQCHSPPPAGSDEISRRMRGNKEIYNLSVVKIEKWGCSYGKGFYY